MPRQTLFGVAALAAATLLLETTLLRLLAVAQFYHFAFLVVSLALLGFGASGTLLAIWPGAPDRFRSSRSDSAGSDLLLFSGLSFAASVGLAYLVINFLPFDSYSIAWERRQIAFFAAYYLVLALPFLFTGLGIAGALAGSRGRSHLVYAANLAGSGLGALLAPLALWAAGVPGAVLASAMAGLGAALLGSGCGKPGSIWQRLSAAGLLLGLAGFAALAASNFGERAPLGMTISPYKGLAQALRYPGSTLRYGRWNAVSRVDVIVDAGTRMLPGLSYAYPDNPPPQHGLSIDADALLPITLVSAEHFQAVDFMPESIAFRLRPAARVLVLEPGGGLGVLQALSGGAAEVTAVLENHLVRRAVEKTAPAADVYAHPRVLTRLLPARVFAAGSDESFDIVFLPLTDAYRPVTSGAYSLAESYNLTAEAFESFLDRLAPGGLLVATRWVQVPPSESLRLIATILAALEKRGEPWPGAALVAFRGVQTMTVLVRPGGWSDAELAQVRDFATERRYDMVWAQDITPEETNRFNRLPASFYYEALRDLFASSSRSDFYRAYPFAVTPPRDDRPFFFHFFTWQQTPQLLAGLGRTWQPFGGSGYFVLLALLLLVLVLGLALIIAPLLIRSGLPKTGTFRRGSVLAYFGLLGLAFLFVEIPLIQRSILLLGQPVYAFAGVVLALLAFSGVGSLIARSDWLPRRGAFAALVGLALLTPWLVNLMSENFLGWPFPVRIVLLLMSLAPLGLLMGLPFPLGLAWLEGMDLAAGRSGLVAWAWAINGCTSVVAAVLAALLALSYGFTLVLVSGALAYALAGILFVITNSKISLD